MKFEILSTKSETNPNDPIAKIKNGANNRWLMFRSFSLKQSFGRNTKDVGVAEVFDFIS